MIKNKRLSGLVLCCLILPLLACQGSRSIVSKPQVQELQELQQHLDQVPLIGSVIGVDEFLGLNQSMRDFLDHNVKHKINKSNRLTQMMKALLKAEPVNLQYRADAHFTAAEAFAHGQANCLSFSALAVAMGQELNLDLRFQEVDLPPSWQLGAENLLLQFRHVNVLAKLDSGKKRIVDFRLARFNHFYPRREISAAQALALHFNNLAIEAMLEQQWPLVFSYLKQALSNDPNSVIAWSNLGLALKRNRHYELADTAYRRALDIDPTDYSVANNLAQLYFKIGRQETARQLQELSSRYRNKNPYYHYSKAKLMIAKKDYPKALELVGRALRLNEKEGNFFQLRAEIHWRMHNGSKAIYNLRQAMELEQLDSDKMVIGKKIKQWQKQMEAW